MVSTRKKRYLYKVLTITFAWLIFGLVYIQLEYALIKDLGYYPSTGNLYDARKSILSTSISTFIFGLVVGYIEVVWLNRMLKRYSFGVKVVTKIVLHLTLIILFLLLSAFVLNSFILDTMPYETKVVESIKSFFFDFAFWSIIIYIATVLFITIFFSEISDNFGPHVLWNYFIGKYHTPKEEKRIFMFLDMKSSTRIAEDLGHVTYFKLLNTYYALMTDPLLNTKAEIYQYVGDEIVVTWKMRNGLEQGNCLQCFLEIKKAVENASEMLEKEFGLVPTFKAAYHLGPVTTGEVGELKEIIYTGDVLNTTSRLQGLCNKYKADILVTEDVKDAIEPLEWIFYKDVGVLELRGKERPIRIFEVNLLGD